MLTTPYDILRLYPVRKTKKQKQAFRSAVTRYAASLGYEAREEQGSFGCVNLVLGDPDKASFLVTAHYDTCAWMPVPNFITPCSLLPYILYQIALILAIILIPGIFGGVVILATENDLLGRLLSSFGALMLLAMLVIGPANRSNANDNTSGVVTVLEIMKSLPVIQWNKVCFVLFDLEEAGLIGSASYRKIHRQASNTQTVINLDCVGDGDELRFFPTRGMKKDMGRMKALYGCCGYFGTKSLLVADKGICFYPSDQMNFPYGVGVAALKKRKKLLYLDKIHTAKDINLDQTNVNILRSAIISMICCSAVKKG